MDDGQTRRRYVCHMIAMTLNSASRSIPAWPLYPLLAVPGLWLFVSELTNPSPDPIRALELGLGKYALQLLVLGLLVTPIRDYAGVNLIRYRRAIGLMAFFYVLVHLVVYLVLDNQFWWDALIKDLTKRPYIIVGVAAFLILLPLALTSNNVSIRRWGPLVWRRIHYGVYAAVILGALHYTLLKKTWQTEPMVYTAIAVALVALRIPRLIRRF